VRWRIAELLVVMGARTVAGLAGQRDAGKVSKGRQTVRAGAYS